MKYRDLNDSTVTLFIKNKNDLSFEVEKSTCPKLNILLLVKVQ